MGPGLIRNVDGVLMDDGGLSAELQGQVFAFPVGGRLRRHAAAWQDLTADPWVLEIVTHGYRPVFSAAPSLVPCPPSWGAVFPEDPDLDSEIQSLLAKCAVVIVPPPVGPGFYCSVFLVPKKTGDKRLIFNMKRLNASIVSPHFKMETLRSIREALCAQEWTLSLDLKDAYLHVPIHTDFQKYLRFVHRGVVYQFVAMPFGLTTAPHVFTSLMKPILAWCHRRECRLHAYLDDWLVRHDSPTVLLDHARLVCRLLFRLGLQVNVPKSRLVPSQVFEFLGALFDLRVPSVRPSDLRVRSVSSSVRSLASAALITARELARTIGLLDSVADLVPQGRWRVRPFHWFRQDVWSPATGSYEDVLPSVTLRSCPWVVWWMNAPELCRGVPLQDPLPDVVMFTDASASGWGAHLDRRQASGLWVPSERLAHINVLELLAVLRGLQSFLSDCVGKTVQVQTDNTTAVAYLRNGGGTRSLVLHRVASAIFEFCLLHSICIQSLHIPGRLNETADALSRCTLPPTAEWTLCQCVCDRIFALWGRPFVDLFATRQNRRLPQFVSPIPDRLAWAADALSMDWRGLDAYLFPPFSLLLTVLRKIHVSPGRFLLVAPNWPAQPWFPGLLQLLVDLPRCLPLRPDLLTQRRGRVLHPDVPILQLHAWLLSSDSLKLRDFHSTLPDVSLRQYVPAPPPSMTPSGVPGEIGVVEGRLIRSLPL